MQYNYDMRRNEFVPCTPSQETGNITGNRVFVTKEDELLRFRIEIDAFGDVVDAMNRLILRLEPGFRFPSSQPA
jgi:hypothetical protein